MSKTLAVQRIGYARVSTAGQSLKTQIERLEAARCDRIFQEQASGAKGSRQELEKALDYIREGDTFIVTRLDRLARSMHDLTKSVALIQEKKVDLVVLDQNIDTGSVTGRLLFNLLGTIAEFERELINERTTEGRERAKAAGVKFGPKEILSEERQAGLVGDCDEGQLSKAEIAKKYDISRASVYRIWKKSKEADSHRK